MRILLVINARRAQADGASAQSPRRDYVELQRALAADTLYLDALDRQLWTRLARRLAGRNIAQALLAWTQAGRYDSIFVDRESGGFALATLCKLRRRRPRLVMIGHLLSTRPKQALFRALRLRSTVDVVVVHSSLQRRLAQDRLGLRAGQIALVPYMTDTHFWTPREAAIKRQVCSAGLEYRDYTTLIKAAPAVPVDFVIAAASHWSKHRSLANGQELPHNVRMAVFDYAGLRQLYAESLFVVVPLHDVENQAGITTILEAMAMGKAVIVSHSRGQTDVVRDRRRRSRTQPSLVTQPSWARSLGVTEVAVSGQTGIYVRPGDPDELQRAIAYLIKHPEQARIMGANGRRLVEEAMSLDHFTARVAALIMGGTGAQPASREPLLVS